MKYRFHYKWHTGDEKPDMRDLHKHIVKQYAVHWPRLGLELGLKEYKIEIIYSIKEPLEVCCAAVLEEWLKITPSPTWAKLDAAIKKITSPVSTDKGRNHGKNQGKLLQLLTYNKY